MQTENILWQGSPSQWVNAKQFSIATVFFIILLVLEAAGFFDSLFNKTLAFMGGYSSLLKTAIFLIPILMAVWSWLQVKFRSYVLTTEVLRECYGVFDRVTEETELYRINDTATFKPFELNIVGLGNVIVYTSDASSTMVVIAAIRQPDELRQLIRQYVEIQRERKGIVEIANYN